MFDEKYLLWVKELVKVRLVHVITHETSDWLVEDFIDFINNYPEVQLTFKQLSGYGDEGRYEEIKKKYPNQFYLDEGDYNIYYMPDNIVRTKFIW
jgi:hypothetical protein